MNCSLKAAFKGGLRLVQVSDIDAVDGPDAIDAGLPRRVGLSRADRTSVDQRIMQRSRLGQIIRDVLVDDSIGVLNSDFAASDQSRSSS